LNYHNTSLLRSSYIKERNFKIENTKDSPFKCDVIFVGHYEADGRDVAIKRLLEKGIHLQLHGTGWEASPEYEYIEGKLGTIKPIYGTDYNLALNSAKIALVFLSKINNDTYTRRCFEIPATGTLMLAEYTTDLAEHLFLENEEALYFKDNRELLAKINTYLANDVLREKIAKAGYKKLHTAGHEVRDRAKTVLEEFEKCKNF